MPVDAGKRWYRHFWLWFLVLLLATARVGSMYTGRTLELKPVDSEE